MLVTDFAVGVLDGVNRNDEFFVGWAVANQAGAFREVRPRNGKLKLEGVSFDALHSSV